MPFEIVMKVESDPGTPIPGAAIVRGGKDIIMTGADGRAKLTLAGKEGDAYEFTVRCPADFTSPSKGVSVYLHHLSDITKIPEYNALCPPTTRKLVVSIRAENGANLPVLYLGKPIARTDSSGTAHILLTMKPGDQFELQLDTSEKGNERLRPRSPTGTFAMRQRDDLQSFDQKFFLEKLAVIPQAKKQRPINVGSRTPD
ncbi:MAG: hypothetical protein ABIP39_03860 [Polyangiaceae bacterium]